MLVRLRVCSVLAVFLLLFLPSCFGFFSFLSFPPPPPPIFRLSDVNGEDLNVEDVWARDVFARNIDANSITINYVVARNELDLNVLHDANFFGMVESLGGFVSDLFCSFSDRENCLDASGPIWSLDNAGLAIDNDLTAFDITANNDLDVTNDLDVLDNADIHGTLTVDESIIASGGIDAGADSNFTNIGASGGVFAGNLYSGNSVFTAFLVDNFGNGILDMSGEPWALGLAGFEITNGDFEVSAGDTNVVALAISGQTFALDFVNLHADPVLPLHAATKEYVDAIDVRGLVNGTIKESFNALVTSDGATVTLNLTKASGDGNLTVQFSSGDVNFNVLDNGSIVLTAGADNSATENFIYVLESDGQTLVKSTSSFPDGVEHTKIGYFVVPSAGFVQANGTYVNQNWNDDISGLDGMGDLAHIGEKLRRITASYFSGVAGNGTDEYLTPTASNVEFNSTSGIIYQKHKQIFGAVDTNVSSVVLVKNWSGDAFHDLTNLFDITADSTGATIGNNTFVNLFYCGVGNKTGEYSPIVINLPDGFYNTQSAAKDDAGFYDYFVIPSEYYR